MPFTTELEVRAVRYTNQYQVLSPLCYVSNAGRMVVVYIGFYTDFASIPALFKFLIDDDGGRIRDAAVLHDYLYSISSRKYRVTRKQADLLFKEAMQSLGAKYWKRTLAYLGVRAFGKRHFKGYVK